MTVERPILICLMQYESRLADGSMTVFDVIEKTRQFGVAGIELRRDYWRDYQQEAPAVHERLAELGLIGTYATFSTLFSSTVEAESLLHHDIETAHRLGSPLLRVFPGPIPPDDNARAWGTARAAVDHAASLGLIIALENFGKPPLTRLVEIQRVLAAIPSPGLKTNIDIGNYYNIGEDVPTAIRAIGDRAVYVHLKDIAADPHDPPTYLGGGILDLDMILDELDRLPQRVLYCFEFAPGDDPDGRIAKSLAYMRRRAERKECGQ